MKTIEGLTGEQLRERATLEINNTGYYQDQVLFFVQLDDDYAVDNEGAIFQILQESIEDLNEEIEMGEFSPLLIYVSESGTVYNFAEDSAKFEEGSEDLEIYSHCCEQAAYLYDNL